MLNVRVFIQPGGICGAAVQGRHVLFTRDMLHRQITRLFAAYAWSNLGTNACGVTPFRKIELLEESERLVEPCGGDFGSGGSDIKCLRASQPVMHSAAGRRESEFPTWPSRATW